MGRRSLKVWALANAAAWTLALPAKAQIVAPPPPRQSVDNNGVDLFLGTFNVTSAQATIGAGSEGFSYFFTNTGSGWTDNVVAALNQSGSVVTVNIGGATDDFTASGTTYSSIEGHGATLTKSGTTYTYTSGNGTVVHFDGTRGNTAPFTASLGRATDITSPSGARANYSYQQSSFCTRWKYLTDGTVCTQMTTVYRLKTVTNSYGYQLQLSYQSDDTETDPNDPNGTLITQWSTITGVSLINTARGGSVSISGSYQAGGFAVTSMAGRTTTYRSDNGIRVAGITRAGSFSENVTVGYSGNRVSSVTTAMGTWSYGAPSDTGGVRTVAVTSPSNDTTSYTFNIASARMTSMTDALGHTSSWQYDSNGRLALATAPEGNSAQYTYDARGNVTATTIHAKPGSGQPNIATSANYASSCTNVKTCNQPNWTKDALGNQTDYAYDPTHGGVTSVTAPAATAGAVRPQVRISYTGYTDNLGGTVYQPTGTSVCRMTASCAGGADETVTSASYGTLAANNLLPVSTTTRAGDSSVSTSSSVTYDTVGNVTSATDPLGAVSTFFYDTDRWRVLAVGPDPDGAGPLHNRAARTNYNADGTVASVEAGTANPDGSGFASLQQTSSLYNNAAIKVRDTVTAGGTTYAVTQYGYDPANRVSCVAVRMNPAAFASLPTDGCIQGTPGADGPDRITRTVTDQVGRQASVTAAYGTALAATEASATYTINGRTATATDANGNVTGYTYDAYDRPKRVSYPSPTNPGTVNAADYEELTYDGNSLVTNRRLRDGQVLNYSYDALKRRTYDDNPNTNIAEADVSYYYDNLGHLLQAADQNGWFKAYEYDALGRMTREHGNISDNHLQYDAAGRRTRQTWADGFYVTYEYLLTGEMTWVRENGSTMLASYGYDDLGRRTALARGNGVNTSYGYDGASRLTSLGHDLNGTAGDLTIGIGYNAAGQITSRTSSNDLYAWSGAVNVDRSYSSNGLNQYTSSGPTTLGYDARGNLTSSGSDTYGYNTRNQLFMTPAGQVLYHDPVGELGQDQGFNFDWAAGQLATEVNVNGVARRYVYGPSDDEPLVWYEGSGTTDKRWLVADERGSVIAVTNASGDAIDIKAYDEYGIPSDTTPANAGRFGYTGQTWLSSLGMWYYKARMYSPTLGRFLQTDPIGYGDSLNWYNYVGSDPVNRSDPSGLLHTGDIGTTVSNTGASSGGTMGSWEWSCYGNCNGDYANSFLVDSFGIHSETFVTQTDGSLKFIGSIDNYYNVYASQPLPSFGPGGTAYGSIQEIGGASGEGGYSGGSYAGAPVIGSAVSSQNTNIQVKPTKPAYCSSKLNQLGSALDTTGRIQQGTAFGAIVLSGGAATEGAAPAYLLGTALRYAGTALQVISGNKNAAAGGVASLFTLPAELSPIGDSVTGSVAGFITKKTIPDPCS